MSKTDSITLRLDPELKDQIADAAKQDGVSVPHWIEGALRRNLPSSPATEAVEMPMDQWMRDEFPKLIGTIDAEESDASVNYKARVGNVIARTLKQ